MAAGDYVKIDNSVITATQADELVQFVESIRTVINLAERVNGRMSHMTAGQIETAYGVAAGQGAALATLVTSCRSAVRSASTLVIIDQYGR